MTPSARRSVTGPTGGRLGRRRSSSSTCEISVPPSTSTWRPTTSKPLRRQVRTCQPACRHSPAHQRRAVPLPVPLPSPPPPAPVHLESLACLAVYLAAVGWLSCLPGAAVGGSRSHSGPERGPEAAAAGRGAGAHQREAEAAGVEGERAPVPDAGAVPPPAHLHDVLGCERDGAGPAGGAQARVGGRPGSRAARL
eukprot:COSAG01_NODE_94_length_26962_cov_9.110933_6_plen_195_part_00